MRENENIVVGPYLLPGLVALPLGVGVPIAGHVLFPLVRGGLWWVGLGVGAIGAAALLFLALVSGGRGPRGLARKVMVVLLAPGLTGLGLGATLLANGVLDTSRESVHVVVARHVRRTDVDGEGAEQNVLVDVDDWALPGESLTLRFESRELPELRDGVALKVTTRAGALGAEWRVR